MAAFGAACSRENTDPAVLAQTITRYYLPDQMRNMRDTTELFTTYLSELMDLLVSDSVKARQVAQEALSNEMSPRLYARIFKEMDR